MPQSYLTQYQVIAQPPSPAAIPAANAATWIYPWSEPVREKINKRLAIALIASGLFAPVPFPGTQPGPSNAAPWIYPWSEPVRLKPQVQAGNQQALFFSPIPVVPQDWRQWLSEPVRQKRGLGAWLQQFDSLQVPVVPSTTTFLEGWYNWFSEPVRFLKGLKAPYQQFLAYHPRLVPNPNVTATMAATETNADIFQGAVNVYQSVTPATGTAGAKVSVVETPIPGSDPVGVRES